ncbi:hypothetical protein QLQ12_44845 [Actinoplanes sp. NEAU-A12]|uniref:Uncharacterized protein n=1 Tax=Actinoplanes sandaracinus TaxID=3045177 RepID=A0ABT6X164_9ACTN|nr:hypothetical protein [Actinoplanes sandaracinus]MDI6105729.1 hypothetical protein [Actinoplanes sandaracinus]
MRDAGTGAPAHRRTGAPAHRVYVTGLSGSGRSRSDLTSRARAIACAMASLEYDLVPGVKPEEVVDGFDEQFLIPASYHADVELPWTTAGHSGFGPAGIESYAGGDRTHGTCGPWPVPDGARLLTFTLYRPPPSPQEPSTPAGTVVIDLVARTAQWTVAES